MMLFTASVLVAIAALAQGIKFLPRRNWLTMLTQHCSSSRAGCALLAARPRETRCRSCQFNFYGTINLTLSCRPLSTSVVLLLATALTRLKILTLVAGKPVLFVNAENISQMTIFPKFRGDTSRLTRGPTTTTSIMCVHTIRRAPPLGSLTRNRVLVSPHLRLSKVPTT